MTLSRSINGMHEDPRDVPPRLRCRHLQSVGSACNHNGCYTPGQGGYYRCNNPHCRGHKYKYDFQCIGRGAWIYKDETQTWPMLRDRANSIIPFAGQWALELICDNIWQPGHNRNGSGDFDHIVTLYYRGHPSIDPQVVTDWGRTVRKVEAARQSLNMHANEHNFHGRS